MRNRELSSQLQRIQSLFKKIKGIPADDLELNAHWAKYLCVLCAGFLEDSMPQLYGDYAKSSANTAIASYTFSQLNHIQNPKTQKFIDVTNLFNKSWGEALEAFVLENGRKDAIDAIMANRNNIAHGEDSGITIGRLTDYLSRSVEVLDFIEHKTLGL